jgi:hypothetical protein
VSLLVMRVMMANGWGMRRGSGGVERVSVRDSLRDFCDHGVPDGRPRMDKYRTYLVHFAVCLGRWLYSNAASLFGPRPGQQEERDTGCCVPVLIYSISEMSLQDDN